MCGIGQTAAMPADEELNATAASLLGFLHDGEASGYELYARAEVAIGPFWSLTRSQVYRELRRLAETGFVEAGEAGVRDRLPYRLTGAGRAAFLAWAARMPPDETIRFPMLLHTAFGRHVPAEVLAATLHEHRARHERRLEAYEEQRAAAEGAADAVDPHAMATLDFGLRYERAVLDWFDALPGAIVAP